MPEAVAGDADDADRQAMAPAARIGQSQHHHLEAPAPDQEPVQCAARKAGVSAPAGPVAGHSNAYAQANIKATPHRTGSEHVCVVSSAPLVPENNASDADSGIFSNGRRRLRWVALFLSCMLLFGNYYAYDNPAALNLSLQQHLGLHYHHFQYLLNLLYSVYSLPNSVLPFFSGALIDRMGASRVLMSLSAAVLLGQITFATGVSAKSIPLMVAGRILFGIGGESISVAQASITTRWFRGKELAFALGMNLSIARLGSVCNAIVTPWIATGYLAAGGDNPSAPASMNSAGVPRAVWFGAVSCAASAVAAAVLVWVIGVDPRKPQQAREYLETATDSLRQPLLDAHKEDYGGKANGPEGCGEESGSVPCTKEPGEFCATPVDYFTFNPTADAAALSREGASKFAAPAVGVSPQWNRRQVHDALDPCPGSSLKNVIRQGDAEDTSDSTAFSSSPIEHRSPMESPSSSTHSALGGPSCLHLKLKNVDVEYKEPSLWSDLGALASEFWMICAICVTLYGTVVPFNNIVSDFLQSKWLPGDPRTAGAIMSIPDTLSAFLVPLIGYLVDRYGRRAALLVFCGFSIMGVHLTLGCTLVFPVFPMLLLGLSYSVYGVSIWPSVACLVTEERQLGLAYGISTSALNISLTVIPVIVATIRVHADSFLPVELFFASLAATGGILSAILWRIDLNRGGRLQAPEISVKNTVIVPEEVDATEEPATVYIAPDEVDPCRPPGILQSAALTGSPENRKVAETWSLLRSTTNALPGFATPPRSARSKSMRIRPRLRPLGRNHTIPAAPSSDTASLASQDPAETVAVASEVIPIVCNPLRGSVGSFNFRRQSLVLHRSNTMPGTGTRVRGAEPTGQQPLQHHQCRHHPLLLQGETPTNRGHPRYLRRVGSLAYDFRTP